MFAFQFTLSGLWHLFFVRLRLSVFFLCVGQLLLIYACCALGVYHVFIIVFAALSKASTPSCLAVMFFFLLAGGMTTCLALGLVLLHMTFFSC